MGKSFNYNQKKESLRVISRGGFKARVFLRR